jgi:hypothetical protein
MSADNASGKFGSCCEGLKDAMQGDGFAPLIAEEDGVLYMSIGLSEEEDEEGGDTLDTPIYFCPFCGTKLQTPEEVDSKIGGSEDD